MRILKTAATAAVTAAAVTTAAAEPHSAPGGGNSDQPGKAASTGGDVENQKASDPPPDKGKQTAPPSSEEEPPTSQKESSEDQDKDKRKKSSDQRLINMLQGMKATLLDLNNLEHDSTAEQKKSEGDNLPGDYKEEEKSREDSMAPVKRRPVAKTTKPRKRDSNRSSKQGEATTTSAALNDVVKSGFFMGKADNEGDTTANDDGEEEDPNFRQDSEVEQNTDLPAENNEEKTLEDSVAAIPLKGRSNTKSRKLDSNRSAQPGGAATLNDAVKCGVFMEKAITEKDDADDLDEGRDEEDNVSGQIKRSVEEEENVSTNSESLQKRNDGRKKAKKNESNRSANTQLQQAKPKRPSVNMAYAAQKKMEPLVNDSTKSGDEKSEGQEAVTDDGGDGGAADIEGEQSLQLKEVQVDPSEGFMDSLGLSELGLANLNEVKGLVEETSGLLQQFMKNYKGRRRQTDTAKSISVASDFMEPQPDIDDDDDDDGELQSLPQEKEPETDERSAEEKATENYGPLLKGKNVLQRPPNKHSKTVRHDLDLSAEDAAMKSDEPEEPGEVTGEGFMEENESSQPEFEAEEKSPDCPVKDEEANVVQESEQKSTQKVGDESGEIREEILTLAAGNVGRNVKAGKLDSHQSAKTQLKQGKGKGSININDVMESGVFEQEQELEQEAKTEESSSLQDYQNVLGLDESLAMSKALLKGNDGPKRPVKMGKSDLNRSPKTQSHLAESMRQKMSYDPQVILEHKEDFIDEDAMEELQDPEQETEEDENEGMRSADFESLLKGNETRGVSKNTKAGKRDSSGLAALNAAMGPVLEQQEEMERAVAPTEKRLSKPQLQLQGKANRATRSSIESGAFEEQIDQEILPDDGGGDGIGDADEEAEAEEEESVPTEELSQSTSV